MPHAGDPPVDTGRLTRPEADAFRYIARSLGARFAGDADRLAADVDAAAATLHDRLDNTASAASAATPDATVASSATPDALATDAAADGGAIRATAPADAVPHAPVAANDARAIGREERRVAALLERLPLALIVVSGMRIHVMNRAALALFGYPSIIALEAAGGLERLFHHTGGGRAGEVSMVAANGTSFPASVTMAPIEWEDGCATLVTVVPMAQTHAAPPVADETPACGDPLAALLEANPDPIALVSPDGTVALANHAFRAVTGVSEGPLAAPLGGRDLAPVRRLLAEARARRATVVADQPVTLASGLYAASAGPVGEAGLACLVLHPAVDAATGAAPALPVAQADAEAQALERLDGDALQRAARQVRRLVRDVAVLVVDDPDDPRPDASDEPEDVAEIDLLRLSMLALAARAAPGSVLTVRRDGEQTTMRLSTDAKAVAQSVLASQRLHILAEAAGRTLGMAPDGSVRVASGRTGAAGAIAFLDAFR